MSRYTYTKKREKDTYFIWKLYVNNEKHHVGYCPHHDILWGLKNLCDSLLGSCVTERRQQQQVGPDENFKLPLHHVVELHLVTSQPTTNQCYKHKSVCTCRLSGTLFLFDYMYNGTVASSLLSFGHLYYL